MPNPQRIKNLNLAEGVLRFRYFVLVLTFFFPLVYLLSFYINPVYVNKIYFKSNNLFEQYYHITSISYNPTDEELFLKKVKSLSVDESFFLKFNDYLKRETSNKLVFDLEDFKSISIEKFNYSSEIDRELLEEFFYFTQYYFLSLSFSDAINMLDRQIRAAKDNYFDKNLATYISIKNGIELQKKEIKKFINDFSKNNMFFSIEYQNQLKKNPWEMTISFAIVNFLLALVFISLFGLKHHN